MSAVYPSQRRAHRAASRIALLLVDEELADQVWEAWDKGETDDPGAWLAWWMIAASI